MAKAELFEKILNTIITHGMFSQSDRLIIALSGGPDSVALTALLMEIKQTRWPALELHLAHLNHQLRGAESARDEDFVRAFAQQIGLPLIIESIDVGAAARHANENLEAI